MHPRGPTGQELEKYGIVEKSFSPYAAGVVLVKKKDEGKFRLCLDFRALNEKTVTEQWQMPTLDTIIDGVSSARPKIFSSLDLSNAFFQLALTLQQLTRLHLSHIQEDTSSIAWHLDSRIVRLDFSIC